MGKADLHIHSTYSDGSFSPRDIVTLAGERGLDIIALTDHDTFDGWPEAQSAGEEHGVKVITGMEITVNYGGIECHLLAYCFDPNSEEMYQLSRDHCRARLQRAKQIVNMLNKQGFDIDIEEVKAEARGLNIARPHIATVLSRKGFVANHREAFMRYLNDHMIRHVQIGYHNYREVINRVRQAGGVTVLAHPGFNYTDFDLEQFRKAGIDGVEHIHPSHNYKLQKTYAEWAEQNQLLTTGGSDFHGNSNTHMQNFGILAVSKKHVYRMQRVARQRKKFSSS